MASLQTKFIVGLFVVAGIAVSILAILWLGMSHFLEEGQLYVAYFDESVQGLDKDSHVKYRGVSIGRVQSIGVAPDGNLIEVVIKTETDLHPDRDAIAQLKSVGITGIMFVELDRKQEGEHSLSPPLSFTSRYPMIATKPSDIKKLLDGINDVLVQFKESDISGLLNNLKDTVAQIGRAVEESRIPQLSEDLRTTLGNANNVLQQERWNRILANLEAITSDFQALTRKTHETVDRFDQLVVRNEPQISKAFDDFQQSMETATTLMENGNSFIQSADGGIEELQTHLLRTARHMEQASANLNSLIEMTSSHPSRLFFGEPMPPRKLESPLSPPE